MYDKDPTALKCDGRCRRRKPRSHFRETPWHGRAAACRDCEGFSVDRLVRIGQAWELEQEQAKVRALTRHIRRLRLRLLIAEAPSSADAMRDYEQPLHDAFARHAAGWDGVIRHVVRLHATEVDHG
ncbi:hypothetical protein I1A49_16525 [Streptomyces malaysiensis subsp. malaysiensis]|uniref:Uncharacterized protein n=1 Tax=Streptomyces malaysiensis TaxID=92644 RepID=A0ABX6W6Q7_STRMQ|nr:MULTISPECIES: hypothetical protein [Streptomyces]QPI56330.1 hypothetical protein I1A49_16525 [Streptomyces solisilvae]UHH17817.1 hypothetical protein LUV23_16640 [Streptomyces sp. HNM0561]